VSDKAPHDKTPLRQLPPIVKRAILTRRNFLLEILSVYIETVSTSVESSRWLASCGKLMGSMGAIQNSFITIADRPLRR